jgi:nitrogen regulatory protein PII
VNFGVTSFSSAAQARADLQRTESSDIGVRGLTVRKVRGLGQQAITLTDNQSAAALVITGSRELEVNISLRGATSRMAVTLAAEAVRRM